MEMEFPAREMELIVEPIWGGGGLVGLGIGDRYVLTTGSEFRDAFPYREQFMSWFESVMILPCWSALITVACAEISTSAPRVLAGWMRWAIVPLSEDWFQKFMGL
jgi:hypothetical protein